MTPRLLAGVAILAFGLIARGDDLDIPPPVIFQVEADVYVGGPPSSFVADGYTNVSSISSAGEWSAETDLVCNYYWSHLESNGSWSGGQWSASLAMFVENPDDAGGPMPQCDNGGGNPFSYPDGAGHFVGAIATIYVRGTYQTVLVESGTSVTGSVSQYFSFYGSNFSCGWPVGFPELPWEGYSSAELLSSQLPTYFPEFSDVPYSIVGQYSVGLFQPGLHLASPFTDVALETTLDVDIIGGVPPVAAFDGRTEARAGESVTFISQSYDPDDGNVPIDGIDIHAWSIDGQLTSWPGFVFAHTFDEVGSYQVELDVTDNEADEDSASQSIEIFCTSDIDCDGDYDFADLETFIAAFHGPNNSPGPLGCGGRDLDGDGDLDLVDFGILGNGVSSCP